MNRSHRASPIGAPMRAGRLRSGNGGRPEGPLGTFRTKHQSTFTLSACPLRRAAWTRWRPMGRLAITLACGDYDRTRALADGRVTVEGADLTVLALGPEEIFIRMARFGEFDVAELSLSTYVL